MSELEKAQLQEINRKPDGRITVVETVPVQFNPTTLRFKLSARTEGGRSRGRQTRQFIGNSSTSLSLELIFDTADEGTTADPVSVRTRTRIVERFVLPKSDSDEKQTTPKLRFSWGGMQFDGVVQSVDIEFDLFAHSGVPLRAKVNLTLEEQDALYELCKSGSGANRVMAQLELAGAIAPGQPGSDAPAMASRTALALSGETPAAFAARVGLDPSAWRSLDGDLVSGPTLIAGAVVGFSHAAGGGAGVGMQSGAAAGASASLAASLGLAPATSASSAASGGAGGAAAAGFALSAAGGVSAGVESVRRGAADSAANATRAAFGVSLFSDGPKVASCGRQSSEGASVTATARGRAPQGSSLTDRSIIERAPESHDVRMVTYGYGIPLRPRAGVPTDRQVVAGAAADDLVRPRGFRPEFTDDPTVAPWVSLPARDVGRGRADVHVGSRRGNKACSCGAGCGCGGGDH